MKRESYFSKPGFYRIEVDGKLHSGWPDRIGAMQISLPSAESDRAVTVLEGRVSDQAELGWHPKYPLRTPSVAAFGPVPGQSKIENE
jgi:hypothetical protein